MKRILAVLFLSIGLLQAQDTLLYEKYNYKEVIVDSGDIWDWPNTNTQLLPALSSSNQYYDVFKVILEWNAGSLACKWGDEYVFVSLNNQVAFIPVGFMLQGAYTNTVVKICSFNGKVMVPDEIDKHGWDLLTNHQGLVMGLWYGSSPMQCNGYILVKIWYRIRNVGSAYN